MSGFDTTISVGRAEIATPTEEAIELGATPSVQIIIGVAQTLPFSAGPGQPPVMVELGTVRFPLDYNTAKDFFEEGIRAVESLPKPSDIVSASNLEAVEKAAQALEKLKAGK